MSQLVASMNERALYYVEMLLQAAEVVNRRSSGTRQIVIILHLLSWRLC